MINKNTVQYSIMSENIELKIKSGDFETGKQLPSLNALASDFRKMAKAVVQMVK